MHIARGLTFWMRSSAPCNRLEEVCGRGRAGLVKRKRSAELVDTDGGAEARKSCGKQRRLGRPRCFVHNTTAHLEPRIPFKNYRHAVSERNMCIEMCIPCTIPSLPPPPCPRPPPSRLRDVSNGKQGGVWVRRGVYLDRPSAVIIFCRKRIRASRLRILNKSATAGNRRNTVKQGNLRAFVNNQISSYAFSRYRDAYTSICDTFGIFLQLLHLFDNRRHFRNWYWRHRKIKSGAGHFVSPPCTHILGIYNCFKGEGKIPMGTL